MDHALPAPIPTAKAPLPSISEFFQLMWSQFRQRYALFLTIAVIANAYSFINPLVVLTWPAESGIGSAVKLILGIANVVLSVWGSLALMAAVVFPDKTPTVGSAFKLGGPFFLDNFTTGLLVSLWVLLGLILLIIPGIIWAVTYMLATFLVMREGISNGAALKRSKALVNRYWFEVFVRTFLFVLLIVVAGLVLGFIFGFSFIGLSKELQTFFEGILSGIVGVVGSALTVILLNTLYQHLAAAQPTSTRTDGIQPK